MTINANDTKLIAELQEDFEPEVTEIESLCMNCNRNGSTRLMLTQLRFFNQVLVSSFSCDHCGFENRSIDPVGTIKPLGQKFRVTVRKLEDLNRKVARPSHSTLDLGELGVFPAREGAITTLEGLFTNVIENIEFLQPERRKQDPKLAEKLDGFVSKIREMLKVEKPFTFVLDDPSGNGLIENPLAPHPDPIVVVEKYSRTHEQNAKLGHSPDDIEDDKSMRSRIDGSEPAFIPEEIMHFNSICPACSSPCSQNMKTLTIPYFKEVIIMALSCEKCGFRDSEVKSGGGIEPKGRRWTLTVASVEDLKRDVLKAETASVNLPELEIEACSGTLNDRFTTVEGLLQAMYDHLSEGNPFIYGDSSEHDEKTKLAAVLAELKKVIAGERYGVKLIIDDPAGNSYVQNLKAPETDPLLIVEDYTRTAEQEDDLGILHMNTKDFETRPEEEAS